VWIDANTLKFPGGKIKFQKEVNNKKNRKWQFFFGKSVVG
jgi:hypothetical protein